MQASGTPLPPAPAAQATPAAAELAEQLLALWRSVLSSNSVGAYAIFEQLDLTLTQVKALTALSSDEVTVKELAERLGLSLPAPAARSTRSSTAGSSPAARTRPTAA